MAVNDLDLITGLLGSASEAGNFHTKRDALNNVEQTVRYNAKAGSTFRVRVHSLRLNGAQCVVHRSKFAAIIFRWVRSHSLSSSLATSI